MTQKEWLERIEGKLDKIQESTVAIQVDVAKNTADLNYHIMRTDLLETKLETETVALAQKIEDENAHVRSEVETVKQDLEPIKKHVNGIKWLVGAILTLGALTSALGALLDWF